MNCDIMGLQEVEFKRQLPEITNIGESSTRIYLEEPYIKPKDPTYHIDGLATKFKEKFEP
eukprot:UN18709